MADAGGGQGGGGSGENNTSSNVGSGEGLAKAKVGVDLPFKSLLGTASEITLVGNTNDVTFSLNSLVARLNVAQSWTALQTFNHGFFKLNPTAGDPTGSNGMFAYNSTTNKFRKYENGAWSDVGSGGGTKTIPFPIVEIVPEGTVGQPDIHVFATAGMKQDGWVLFDGASTSKINFRGYLPPTLAATPNMKIIVMIITLGVVSPAKAVHLTITGEYKNTGEDMDVAQNDVSISADITLATTIETPTYHTFDPATDPANNDIFTFQIERDPVDAGDLFTDDILIFVKGVVDV